MKKYRRIEITAFRRRVLIISGDPLPDTGEVDVQVNHADSRDTIQTESDEGQEILIEAIRLLEERIRVHSHTDEFFEKILKEP